MNDKLNYLEYKTIVYSPLGYYGSKYLWNDASYAFKARLDKVKWISRGGLTVGIDQSDKWDYLTNNRKYLAEKLDVDIDVLPEWDYEFCVIER